jgi:hypothetical protein
VIKHTQNDFLIALAKHLSTEHSLKHSIRQSTSEDYNSKLLNIQCNAIKITIIVASSTLAQPDRNQ